VAKSKHQSEVSWKAGYEDGFEGRITSSYVPVEHCSDCYARGFERGKMDREEVQRSGSSNT
jgi:hypothetical protein